METQDFKNVWKSETGKNIQTYSDTELSGMIVKSARRSIRRNYPSVFFIWVIAAVVMLLITNITVRYTNTAMKLLDLAVLLFLTVCLTLWTQSFLTMKNYKADMPVKDWLEYRIGEMEKSLRFNTRYSIMLSIIAISAALGYYYLFIQFSHTAYNPWVIGIVTAGAIVFIILAQKSVIKKSGITLQELKKLHKQFEK